MLSEGVDHVLATGRDEAAARRERRGDHPLVEPHEEYERPCHHRVIFRASRLSEARRSLSD